jgi:signal transduction histidine kinase/ActR/RegA family two-component response regulator
MPDPKRSPWLGYGSAVLSVALATLVRKILDPVLGDQSHLVTLFLAVIFTAWYGGPGPALAAIGLGYLAAGLFLIPPGGALLVRGLDHVVEVLLYLVVSIGIVLFTSPVSFPVDRQAANDRVHSQIDELETLMDVMPIAIFRAHDAACRRITGNRASYELLRLPPASNVSKTPGAPGGEPAYKLFRAGKELAGDELPMQYAAAHGVEIRDVELDLVLEDGTTKHIYGYAKPLFGEDGKVRGCLAAFLDITERKRLEEEIERRAAELAETDRRKTEFLAMLAHELRNPLAPIRNALHILKMPDASALTLDQARTMMERQVQHMVRLVEDLLDVSRITGGKIRLQKETLDLATVINRAVEDTRPLMDANRHALTVSLPSGPIYVDADRTRLEQVFANLLNNAAKYTERGGSILVAAERHGAEVEVRVRDSGFGIPAHVLPHIFDLFTQADRTLERSEGGLGIGLSLVRQLVELHGGQVTAHSDGPGQGSEFMVRLPVKPAGQEAAGTAQAVPPAAAEKKTAVRRVLVVDDNQDSVDSIALLLRLWGHEVRTAHEGQSALKAARTYQPQVVLMDIGLPGMSGHEVARQLRQEWSPDQMLLVALTGYGQDEDRRRSQEAGIDQHLVKPVDPAALQALLESAPQGSGASGQESGDTSSVSSSVTP